MILFSTILWGLLLPPQANPGRLPFAIRVVDAATGRGVPLIELRTNDAARHVTDNAGLVAFDEPGLMGTEVFFGVKGHGYTVPADGFGYRGVRLRPEPGGEATIRVERVNIAERLYRVTGGGLYRDSLILGRPTPLRSPDINGLVVGQDSVVNGLCNGTLYWFWGDTSRPAYPLGNFHVPGATSKLPGQGGLDPDVGVDLSYYVDAGGFARPTAQLPGEGPTWIFGVVVLKGGDGRERMLGSYVKVRNLLEAYEHGAVEFDEVEGRWIKRATWPEGAPVYPGGQPVVVDEGGERWIYFANALPDVRTKADVASYLNLSTYEALTPLRPGSKLDQPEVERDADGRLVVDWKRNAPPSSFDLEKRLIDAGVIRPEEATFVLRDVETGRPIRPHGSSLMWNPDAKMWSLIVLEAGGSSSYLGEVWYAEAEGPRGPWGYARKVVTHDRYSFYNPRLHPYFSKHDGRLIYFEGTYTASFSGNTDPTPRYDYNQIMYRLDVSDPRLNLPRPLDRIGGGRVLLGYAMGKPGHGLVPVVESKDGGGRLELGTGAGGEAPRFFVAPDGPSAPPLTRPLHEYAGAEERPVYSIDPDLMLPGRKKTGRIIGRVWPSPGRPSAPPSVPR